MMLWRASRRHITRHPWQFALAVLGIALGVAVTVAIDLANGSARRAFELATEAVTGRATDQIVGGPSGVADAVYVDLRVALHVRDAAPVVASDVAVPARPGVVLHLLGVDPIAEAPFRPYLARRGTGTPLAGLGELLTTPGAALMTRAMGARLGLVQGNRLPIRVAGSTRSLVVAGWIDPGDALSARALEHMVVVDVASAQELLGTPGRLTRIDLVLPSGPAGDALRARIAARLPPGVEMTPAGARAESAARLTRAFSLNLAALSLLALVVGMFLVYNTMTFSVVQRRALIGTLRALGVTRAEVFRLIGAEALVVGTIGTGLGVGLGLALAHTLLALVSRTINDLYFVLAVREVSVTAADLARGGALGIGATVLAALAPALEATGARPRAALLRSTLEARARRAVPWVAAAGVAVLALGAAVMAAPMPTAASLAGLFAVVLGCALLTPAALLVLLRPIAVAAEAAVGILGRLATRGIAAALSRTAVAIAALMVAVAATVGVGLMISSFREAVARWLEGTLRADVYVSPPSLIGNRSDATLPPAVIDRLIHAPGVAGASTTRAVVAPSPRGPVNVLALGLAGGRRPGFRFRDAPAAAVWTAFDRGDVVVSEPFANRHGIRAGETVRLRTDGGERDFRVAGVFYDYGSTAGVVAMARATFERHWEDRAVSGLALEAAPGQDVAALVEDLRRAAGDEELLIRSNRGLREASMAIFDRTFAITSVLRLAIVAVAFLGVVSALMALELDRAREMATLRALGCAPGQVWRIVTGETALMGALAGLLALPVGVGLAAALIHVVNRRSFGWTMPLDLSPRVLLEGLGIAVAAAVLAGLYPAWRMASAPAAEALRDE
jgi:putative ABC transport system permease protein